MKKLHILSLAAATALASTLAFAQATTPSAMQAERARPDANGDGVISKAEAAKYPKLAERFAQLDKNGDGKLGREEMPMRRGGGHAHRGGMQALDTDKDGRISRAEMQAGAAAQNARFEQMDVNKDGYVDAADRQARHAARRGECFAKADADKNGQLSRAEFDKLGEACGMRSGGQHRPGMHARPAPAAGK